MQYRVIVRAIPDTCQMSLNLLISAAFLPVMFWAAYHYHHDRHRPEPVINLIIALGLGAAASLLADFCYSFAASVGLRFDVAALAESNLLGLFAYAVLGIGLIEELAKMLPFLFIVLRFRAFDEPLDGIVYASFLGLGFASVENLHFFNHLSATEAIARGFAGPLVHIVFASVWGYHIGAASLAGQSVVKATLVWLCITATLHGIYDFVVLAFANVALVVAAAIIVAVWIWRLRLILQLNGDAITNQEKVRRSEVV